MLDLTKPVQTRDGCKVRILCADRKGTAYPIVGLIEREGGEGVERVVSWTLTGGVINGNCRCIDDLINVPTKQEPL